MISIQVTPAIKIEIKNSIADFRKLIAKEMSISQDLRHNHKIEIWNAAILKLELAIQNGVL